MPIIPTSIADNNPLPGVYYQTTYAQGPSSGPVGSYSILLMGNKSSAGTADDGYTVNGPDTQTPLRNEADCISLYGPGSELHGMYRAALKAYPGASIYGVVVKESTGSAATGTITVTNNATANSTLRIWVEDEFVDVGIVSGDTPTLIAQAIASAVNAKLHFPVTASPSSGTVTLTAKCKGLRGNAIGILAKVLVSCGVVVTPSVPTKLSGGTTADSVARALESILGQRFYYIATAVTDSTNLGLIVAQIASQALASSGITQRLIFGSNDASLANVITLATGINHERATVAYQCEGDASGGKLAASLAGCLAAREASFTTKSLNHNNLGDTADTSTMWTVQAPLSGRRLTQNEQISCLNNGISPVRPTRGGKTEVVKVITTKSLNGSTSDYRVRDWHIVTVGDRFGDAVMAAQRAQFGNKLVADDPAEGEQTPPDTVTPRLMTALLSTQVKDFASRGFFKKRDEIIASIHSVHETSPKTRIAASLSIQVADLCDQVVTSSFEVGG